MKQKLYKKVSTAKKFASTLTLSKNIKLTDSKQSSSSCLFLPRGDSGTLSNSTEHLPILTKSLNIFETLQQH